MFQANTRYRLADLERYDDECGEGYAWVACADYGQGMYITDCWIMDEAENIHPGYANSPMPIRFDDVLPQSATRLTKPLPDGIGSVAHLSRS